MSCAFCGTAQAATPESCKESLSLYRQAGLARSSYTIVLRFTTCFPKNLMFLQCLQRYGILDIRISCAKSSCANMLQLFTVVILVFVGSFCSVLCKLIRCDLTQNVFLLLLDNGNWNYYTMYVPQLIRCTYPSLQKVVSCTDPYVDLKRSRTH